MKNKILASLLIIVLGIITGCTDNDDDLNQLNYKVENPGYFIDNNSIEILFTKVSETNSNYEKIISRNFNTEDEKKLIEIAEKIYPDRESIITEFNNSEEIVNYNGSLWWFNIFDGIKLPYAITGSAIQYYNNLIDLYRLGDFETAKTIENFSAKFEYNANIKFHERYTSDKNENFKNVYVVDLDLKWTSHCGSHCALWVSANRTVIIDEKTKKIYVLGDEHVPVFVS